MTNAPILEGKAIVSHRVGLLTHSQSKLEAFSFAAANNGTSLEGVSEVWRALPTQTSCIQRPDRPGFSPEFPVSMSEKNPEHCTRDARDSVTRPFNPSRRCRRRDSRQEAAPGRLPGGIIALPGQTGHLLDSQRPHSRKIAKLVFAYPL